MLDFIREYSNLIGAGLVAFGFVGVIGYMFKQLTPTNRDKVPNLKGKYSKTIANAALLGAATVALLIALGII